MAAEPWSDRENDRIVADYFAMLRDDISGRAYNTAEHRRDLTPQLPGRSDMPIAFKDYNISAVLAGALHSPMNVRFPAFRPGHP